MKEKKNKGSRDLFVNWFCQIFEEITNKNSGHLGLEFQTLPHPNAKFSHLFLKKRYWGMNKCIVKWLLGLWLCHEWMSSHRMFMKRLRTRISGSEIVLFSIGVIYCFKNVIKEIKSKILFWRHLHFQQKNSCVYFHTIINQSRALFLLQNSFFSCREIFFCVFFKYFIYFLFMGERRIRCVCVLNIEI